MRILIPTIDYLPIEGGIASLTLHVGRALCAQGHEVILVAPWFPGMEEADAHEPMRIIRFRGYSMGLLRLIPFLWACRGLAPKTDLVLAINVAYGGILARWTKLRFGVPYVSFAYAYEFLKYERAPGIAFVLRNIYRRALFTVAISQYTRERLEAFAGVQTQVEVILPGAAQIAVRGADAAARMRAALGIADEPMVLAVGRFIKRKGHLTLVRALQEIHESCPNTHLVLVGRGPQRARCMDWAREAGLEAFVHCPGYVDDAALADYYEACDVFALPTGEDEGGHVEGFGLVFTEAHAHGKPVVAGRSGGAPEAVLHEKTGLLVKPEKPAEAAAAIVRLLRDRALAQRLGEAGRARVARELNWTTFAERLMAAVAARR